MTPEVRPGKTGNTFAALASALALSAICAATAQADETAKVSVPAAKPFAFPSPEERKRLGALSAADEKAMMDLLNIAEPPALPPPADDPSRPANTTPVPNSGNWTDGIPGHTIVRSGWGNWSNYDLSKADRFPIPDVLTSKDGTQVSDAATWWNKRRPEIVEDFQREIYGRIPAATPQVTWEAAPVQQGAVDGTATLQVLTGSIDNASYPAAKPVINVALYLPNGARGPVPLMVVASWGTSIWNFGPPPKGRTALQQVIAHGWGYALVDTYGVQADNGAGLREGIIGLTAKGRQRSPDDWGALSAWSWGLSRALDYFVTDKDIDPKRIGIEGHSRWGKEALLAAALDPRWAIVFSSCSGEGGAKLHRHDVGESVDNVSGSGEYHWMAGNFLKYAGHWDRLPVDQHELIALVAPRPVFITGGTEDLWSDPAGEFKACVAAGPVYGLLGKSGMGISGLPAPDAEIISGDIGFRLHAGGHTDLLDWPTFLKFADKYFSAPAS